MTTRELVNFLLDILEMIEIIEEFTVNISFEDLTTNKEKIFALQKCLENIGEAVKHIPEELRNDYPHIPWRNIAGMRDKLIHEYWNINVTILWKTLKNRIPELKSAIVDIISLMEKEGVDI